MALRRERQEDDDATDDDATEDEEEEEEVVEEGLEMYVPPENRPTLTTIMAPWQQFFRGRRYNTQYERDADTLKENCRITTGGIAWLALATLKFTNPGNTIGEQPEWTLPLSPKDLPTVIPIDIVAVRGNRLIYDNNVPREDRWLWQFPMSVAGEFADTGIADERSLVLSNADRDHVLTYPAMSKFRWLTLRIRPPSDSMYCIPSQDNDGQFLPDLLPSHSVLDDKYTIPRTFANLFHIATLQGDFEELEFPVESDGPVYDFEVKTDMYNRLFLMENVLRAAQTPQMGRDVLVRMLGTEPGTFVSNAAGQRVPARRTMISQLRHDARMYVYYIESAEITTTKATGMLYDPDNLPQYMFLPFKTGSMPVPDDDCNYWLGHIDGDELSERVLVRRFGGTLRNASKEWAEYLRNERKALRVDILMCWFADQMTRVYCLAYWSYCVRRRLMPLHARMLAAELDTLDLPYSSSDVLREAMHRLWNYMKYKASSPNLPAVYLEPLADWTDKSWIATFKTGQDLVAEPDDNCPIWRFMHRTTAAAERAAVPIGPIGVRWERAIVEPEPPVLFNDIVHRQFAYTAEQMDQQVMLIQQEMILALNNKEPGWGGKNITSKMKQDM